MTEPGERVTGEPPVLPVDTPGWGTAIARLHPTTSSLSSWSWRDIAHSLAGALAVAMPAVALLGWAVPVPGYSAAYPLRLLLTIPSFLLWALVLTAGLALTQGQMRRAFPVWRRQLLRALAIAAGGTILAAALAAVWTPAMGGVRLAYLPLLGWPLLGAVVGLALAVGYPRACPRAALITAGIVAGGLLGLLLPLLLRASAGLHGPFTGILTQLLVLLPAAVLVAGVSVATRELVKSAWLLVVFGDEPGRHYLLDRYPFTIGTDPACDLVLEATGGVQPRHAAIRREGRGAIIVPCAEGFLVSLRNSATGVSELYDGDELQIGDTMLRYYIIP